jgi:hypothetical protein
MSAKESFVDAIASQGSPASIRSSQPDMVEEAAETFGGKSNRFDTTKRERLPISMYSMELERSDHPVSMLKRLTLTNMQLSVGLFVTFCLSTLVLAPLSRLFGDRILSPVTYPIICFLCGLGAYYRFTATGSFTVAARVFIIPQSITIFIEWAYSPGINPWWSVLPVALSLVAIGYLTDQVTTHNVQRITANLRLKREAVERRRAFWEQRFNWLALTREIKCLRIEARLLENQGKTDEAFILHRRAGELLELREYPLGFLALVYIGVLLFVGASSTMLLLSGFAVSLALAFRRPVVRMKLSRLITEVTIHSFVSWLSWDTLQTWVHSPGMFRDTLRSPFRRLTQTVLCFLLIEIAFIPPVHRWGSGEMLTPKWLWSTEYNFLVVGQFEFQIDPLPTSS